MIQPAEILWIHTPKVSVKFDMRGGVDIKLDDFVYVHINYDYRYTSNSARRELAYQIAAMLGYQAEVQP